MTLDGWCGRILHLDLSNGNTSVEEPDVGIYRQWIGGRGLAGLFLEPHVTRDPEDPCMPLLLFTGPLVNTSSPTSGRSTFMSRSPLTGAICDASVGGTLGTELKRSGFDGIVMTGRAERPCGVEINGESVVFTDARDLVGDTLPRLNDRLRGKGARAACGPAAHHGVRFASIMVDRAHAAGRGGLGLVFANKNLKYITVKGRGKTPVHDSEELAKAREDVFRLVSASPALLGEFGISRYGTAALYDLISQRGMTPTANFRRTWYPHTPRVNAHAVARAYRPKKAGCRGCHVLCKKKGAEGPLPEYETLSHFTALLENPVLEVAVAANRLCNETGMDTISAAVTLACHAEIKGLRPAPDDIVSMLGNIAHGRGQGVDMGQGAVRYAARRGRPECAMAVKGLELPAYDPRGAYGMALAYATSTRGGCHLRAYPISHEILRKPVATNRFSFEGKARIIKIAEDANAVVDSLTACKFVFFAASLEEYARVYSAVTGYPATGHELLRVGARIYDRERRMNAACGFDAADDVLPERFFHAPENAAGDPTAPPLPREDFFRARHDYYKVRGLDENGLPVSIPTERGASRSFARKD